MAAPSTNVIAAEAIRQNIAAARLRLDTMARELESALNAYSIAQEANSLRTVPSAVVTTAITTANTALIANTSAITAAIAQL